MKHRFSIDELAKPTSKNYLSDDKMIRAILADRMQDCTNVNAPLYQRLQSLYRKYDKMIEAQENELSKAETYIPAK